MRDQAVQVLWRKDLNEVTVVNLQNAIHEIFEFTGSRQSEMALEDDAVKQDNSATIKLVNLVTKRDSVFMAFSFGKGACQTPY